MCGQHCGAILFVTLFQQGINVHRCNSNLHVNHSSGVGVCHAKEREEDNREKGGDGEGEQLQGPVDCHHKNQKEEK